MQDLEFFIGYVVGLVMMVAIIAISIAVYQWMERLFDNVCCGTLDLFESQWGAL